MEGAEVVESPRKRLKVDNVQNEQDIAVIAIPDPDSSSNLPTAAQAKGPKEVDVGITEFVTTDIPGFEGILKKRYTDFLVNEIPPSGEVLHLQSLSVPASLKTQPPKDGQVTAADGNNNQNQTQSLTKTAPDEKTSEEKPEFKVSDDDRTLLDSMFGPDVTSQIIEFHARILASPASQTRKFGQIEAGVVDDKEVRTNMHMTLRRVFNSLLESRTDAENNMIISAAPNRHNKSARGFRGESGQRPARASWDERGGQYLHFTIYKENKDTMEVISFLARQLKMNGKSFQFAGTKDRRAVTVQRASVFKVVAERLAGLNKTLRNAAVGDFEYKKHGLELGELEGNEFVITLRDCQFFQGTKEAKALSVSQAEEIVGQAMHNLRQRGYLNYYGMQRFGTFSLGTHEIGLKMLQGDFKAAADAILNFSPQALAAAQDNDTENTGPLIGQDDKARAEAIHTFQTTRNTNIALDKLPRKFSAEACLIRALGRSSNDYVGALQTIPRNLRLMYVHAYQSLVWNFAAGERWRLYGDKVVEGDLVISNQKRQDQSIAQEESGVDADGEVIVAPQAEDSANAIDDVFVRARPLSAEEAASGQYSIFDVVLPLPGYDIVYPANRMTEFYKSFMASERGGGLDPFDMRRKWKDISLSGSYRKLLSRPGPTYSYEVKAYSQDDEKFVKTDLEELRSKNRNMQDTTDSAAGLSGNPPQAADTKIGIVLKFQLGSSQYATMALRELMKSGGLKEYKPDFSGR